MYWYVPTIVPSPVSGLLAVTAVGDDDNIGDGLARPKSSSLAPDLVSMMFPGLRSRCTIPLLWALSSASAI